MMEFYSNESNLIFVELKPRVNPWKIDMYIYKRDKFGFRNMLINIFLD